MYTKTRLQYNLKTGEEKREVLAYVKHLESEIQKCKQKWTKIRMKGLLMDSGRKQETAKLSH